MALSTGSMQNLNWLDLVNPFHNILIKVKTSYE